MKQLDPKAVWLFFFQFVIFCLIAALFIDIGLGITFFTDADGRISFEVLKWLWIIIPALLIFAYIWAKLSYHFYRYELTDAGFRKESGVIYKKYVTIPYDRIQNVDIYRGILARILGLSDLHIQTAGASGAAIAEGRLPGLPQKAALQLRDEVIKRAHHSKNQGI